MNFLVKKTTELTDLEQQEILRLFNDVFQQERTLIEFQNQYTSNVLGYSYHSLIVDNGSIVGMNVFVPGAYMVQEVQHLFVVSIDTMIRKSHRGIENFYDLVANAFKRMKEDGIAFAFGFPNDVSFPVFTATELMPEIGRMDVFCLPLRVGEINKKYSLLNPLSRIFCKSWLSVASIFASNKVHSLPIHKNIESFNATRYQRMDGAYQKVNLPGLEFYYKVKTILNIRTATLIDVTDKSAINFCKAVRYILKKESHQVDLLLYVGHLPFNNTGMIRIPRKFEPKKFYFNGVLFDKKNLDSKLLFDIGNWDINLADFDLI